VDDIRRRAAFTFIRYSNCWEDAAILREALQPAPGRRILSVASAGDNSFSLLAAGARVCAVDLNPAQLALVELKRAAIRHLEHDECLAFLGLRPAGDRPATWRRLAPELSPPARAFWNERPQHIEAGLIHAGKFERYFRLFRRWVLPLLHDRRTCRALLEPKSAQERAAFYRDVWDSRRWRLLFRLFFGRTLLGRLGRDPEFFRYVDEPVGETILRRVRRALIELPGEDNPYLEYILTGTFQQSLPDYLRPASYAGLRQNLELLELAEGSVEDVLAASDRCYDGFNLSDILEYLDGPGCERLLRRVLERSRPGARIAYWNMLAPRRLPESLAGRARSLDGLAAGLFARDRAFFYRDFRVEEVLE